MNFLSLEFWPVLAIFLVAYYLVSSKIQNILLLIANALFIYTWGIHSAIILGLSLVWGYVSYLCMTSGTVEKHIKKILLVLFVAVQVSILFYFKITLQNFPIGISYYTFTIIAYTLEVFWKRTDLKLNFFEYILSVSFFPVILMGPIERLSRFSSQFRVKRNLKISNFETGALYLALGIFKITAISNPLSPLIQHNSIIAQELYGLGLITYCLLSFFKLYAEFSGFIDIVTGISVFLGLRIARNFDRPYLAVNVNDVWRRWHISLTSWVRDFVFLPLVLKTRNVLLSSIIVFVIVAAWHGLNLNFLYWGLYWIICYLIHLALLRRPIKIPHQVKVLLTLMITSLSTLSFLIPVAGFTDVISRLVKLSPQSFNSLLTGLNTFHISLVSVTAGIGIMMLMETYDHYKSDTLVKSRMILLVFLIALLGEFTLNSLLYLRV